MLTKTTTSVLLVLAVILVLSEAYWSRQNRRQEWNGGRMWRYNYGRSRGYDYQEKYNSSRSIECKKSNDSGVIVCENTHMYLKCLAPSTISISQAIYGRTENASVCPFPTPPLSTNCTSAFSDAIIKGLCNGLQFCDILISNLLGGAGGDPCPGTYKYINVTYRCV